MKKKKTKLIILICIILLTFISQTIAYSAINSTLNISGNSYARVQTDVRVTNFKLANTNNGVSSFEEFGKNYIITEVDLKDTTSYVTYYIEITNYGSSDVGIYSITGLPSGVNYSIKNYNLHDKICDDTGKCNNFIKQTYELTLTTTGTYKGTVQLYFDFRTYHKIIYTDVINHNYPTEVIDGGNLSITLQEKIYRLSILSGNTEINYYEQTSIGQTINITNITDTIEFKEKRLLAKLNSGDLNTVGSEICIGNECFHLLANNGSTVTMFAKYNLYVGNFCTTASSCTAYGSEATGLQNSTMLGYRSPGGNRYGTISYSATAYWDDTTNYPAYVYNENSYLYKHINNYANYLTNQGITVVDARPITKDELLKLGCSSTSDICSSTKYSWAHNTSYWTGTALDSSHIYFVRDGGSNLDDFAYNAGHGVRPVIEIPIDQIEPITRLVSGDYDTVGSQVCIKDECFYVISSDNSSVTMLAKYNLHVGNEVTSFNFDTQESTYIKITNPTGKQNQKAIAYNYNMQTNNVSYPWIGTTPYSTEEQITSTNSIIVLDYISNYQTYLTSIGAKVNEVRLPIYDELEILGCDYREYECMENAPKWLYSTSYWVTDINYDLTYVMLTENSIMYAHNLNNGVLEPSVAGVRPVINILKSQIK